MFYCQDFDLHIIQCQKFLFSSPNRWINSPYLESSFQKFLIISRPRRC